MGVYVDGLSVDIYAYSYVGAKNYFAAYNAAMEVMIWKTLLTKIEYCTAVAI